jgi:hypothetical protein
MQPFDVFMQHYLYDKYYDSSSNFNSIEPRTDCKANACRYPYTGRGRKPIDNTGWDFLKNHNPVKPVYSNDAAAGNKKGQLSWE